MSNLKRICLYGGPGAGRSTLAADVFSALKKKHYPVELVDETAKLDAWDKKTYKGRERLKLVVDHMVNEEKVMLNGGIVVTTGGPYQNAVYAFLYGEANPNLVASLAEDYDRDYESVNFLVTRSDNIPYRQEGRYETEEAAKAVDAATFATLCNCGVEFIKVKAHDTALVVDIVEGRMRGATWKSICSRGP